jgi:HEAT repeat protein
MTLCAPAFHANAGPPPPPCDKSSDTCLRLSWIEQVLSGRDMEAIPNLRSMAAEDPHERVRESSLGSLVTLGDRGAADIFLSRLSDDPSPSVRRAAAEGIGLLGFRVLPGRLAGPLRDDPDPMVRAECARAIGRTDRSEAGPALVVALLQDSSPEVRALSSEALARIQTQWGVEMLKQAAQDEDPIVRLYAIRGLAEFSPASAVSLFKEIWGNTSDTELRIEAFRGLLNSRAGGNWIESGLADQDDRIRFLSLRNLLSGAKPSLNASFTRGDAIIVRIASFLSDPSRGIRELAKEHLEKLDFKVSPKGFGYELQ